MSYKNSIYDLRILYNSILGLKGECKCDMVIVQKKKGYIKEYNGK